MSAPKSTALRCIAVVAAMLVGLWLLSQWWERTFAHRMDVEISPMGCFRLEAYKPFWVLPTWMHGRPAPSPSGDPLPFWKFPEWESPVFYRLYDRRNGQLVAETAVHEATFQDGVVTWGGYVTVGMIEVADIRDRPCVAPGARTAVIALGGTARSGCSLDADGFCRTGQTLTERPMHIATEAPPPAPR